MIKIPRHTPKSSMSRLNYYADSNEPAKIIAGSFKVSLIKEGFIVFGEYALALILRPILSCSHW